MATTAQEKINSLPLQTWSMAPTAKAVDKAVSSAQAYEYEALKHAEMREDTAIQRQVADLKAAGLNPVLAATGGYTGASSAAATKALSSDSDRKNANTNRMGKILSAAISILSLGFLK